jgi:translation initiation factor 6
MDLYRSPNIGVFLKCNERTVLVPKGLASTKSEKLASLLGAEVCPTSVGGSRLLGPLVCMNGNGVVLSRLAEDMEVAEISKGTGLPVARFDSKLTAVGNLVAANDRRAVVSPLLDRRAASQVGDVLGVEVSRLTFREYAQVGALVVATNTGAAVYPDITDEEAEGVSGMLGVEAHQTSVNKGVPFVASGVVANSRNAVVGNQTTGPELVFITRALKV